MKIQHFTPIRNPLHSTPVIGQLWASVQFWAVQHFSLSRATLMVVKGWNV